MRFHLCAPGAQQAPKNSERKPDDALRAECSQGAETGEQDDGHEQKGRTQVDPVGEGDAGCEEPRGVKQRHLTQSCAQWCGLCRRVWPAGALHGL